MVLAKRPTIHNNRRNTVNIDGDDIRILAVGFEISETTWNKMQELMFKKYGSRKHKSQAMRVLVSAVVLGIVDLDDLEKKVEKEAEKTEEVIYI